MLQVSRSGVSVVVDLYLPTDRPGVALRCRIDLSSQELSSQDLSQDLSRLRRQIQQTANHRSSTWAIAGMVLLLAVCGGIVGGAEGFRQAMGAGLPGSNGPAI